MSPPTARQLERNIQRMLAFSFLQAFMVLMPAIVLFFESRGLTRRISPSQRSRSTRTGAHVGRRLRGLPLVAAVRGMRQTTPAGSAPPAQGASHSSHQPCGDALASRSAGIAAPSR